MSTLQHQTAELSRLVELARAVLGGSENATQWFATPQCGLGGRRADLILSDQGAREVEILPLRIEHNVYS